LLEEKHTKLLDKSGVKWFYEYKSFSYINSNGKRRTYTPDFYFFGTGIKMIKEIT